MQRSRLIIGAVVVAVALVALTFPLWRPFFVSNVIDEAFPELSAVERDQVRAMPEDQQTVLIAMAEDNAAMAADTVRALMMPDVPMDEPMPTPVAVAVPMLTPPPPASPEPAAAAPAASATPAPAEAVVLSSGMFGTFDPVHSGSGSATIYQLADGRRILRFENFQVNNGPDLHVYLAERAPSGILDSHGADFTLGPLKGNVGNQNHEIPPEVDLSQYTAVVIWCLPFSVNFTAAPQA